jgi:hypothetical protein
MKWLANAKTVNEDNDVLYVTTGAFEVYRAVTSLSREVNWFETIERTRSIIVFGLVIHAHVTL